MSTNRKLRRAQARRAASAAQLPPAASAAASPRRLDKQELRQQSSAQRFAQPGSRELWIVLLGWSGARLARMQLCDAVHDGVVWLRHLADSASGLPAYDPVAVHASLRESAPALAGALTPALLDDVVQRWFFEGDGFDPAQVPERFAALLTLAERAGVAQGCDAAALQLDWESWQSMAFASDPRAQLLRSLEGAELAAASLAQVTGNARLGEMSAVFRALWSSLAYAQESTLSRMGSALAALTDEAEGGISHTAKSSGSGPGSAG